MLHAIISGDIISSTSLEQKDKVILEEALSAMITELDNSFNVFGRVVKGDNIECSPLKVKDALTIALAIKSYVKSIPLDVSSYKKEKKRVKLFKEHGIRVAIGLGSMDRLDFENGVMDGEAIYMAGRKINSTSTYNKDRITIKNTLFFISKDNDLNREWEAILGLLDVLLAKATARQSEVLYLKLLGNDESTISKKLGIDQSVVNRHSTSVGWNAIEGVVAYFASSFSH
ncbi:fumarate hydratase [Patiriisocius hiemis]|uniref:Fumarate hydratase n=1 Tax=Patiriisocius hiemis TaxID=3075604 RepID=A0ABU2YBL5_9FLAO|nr:fumarate hydratase [Constantimarinum sp. W242]MDT0555029.1 fumarate hydratase [Constantimarinum sp. W242]